MPPSVDLLRPSIQELARLSYQGARKRIPKPIRLDYLLTIDPNAEFEQPSFYHFHLSAIEQLQIVGWTAPDNNLIQSEGVRR